MMERKCITVPEMGKTLGIARATAYNLARSEGFYPAFHIGKKVLINLSALDRWIDEQSNAGTGVEE